MCYTILKLIKQKNGENCSSSVSYSDQPMLKDKRFWLKKHNLFTKASPYNINACHYIWYSQMYDYVIIYVSTVLYARFQ